MTFPAVASSIPRHWLGRANQAAAYLFVVAALSVFLTGLLVCRSPVVAHISQVTATSQSTRLRQFDSRDVRELVTLAAVREALDELSPPRSMAEHQSREVDANIVLHSARVLVEVSENGGWRFSLEAGHPNATVSRELVRRLAVGMAEELDQRTSPAQTPEDLEGLDAQVSTSGLDEARARSELRRRVASLLEAVRATEQSRHERQLAGDQDRRASEIIVTRVRLQMEQENLERDLRALREKLTPDHPRLAQLEGELASVRDRLQAQGAPIGGGTEPSAGPDSRIDEAAIDAIGNMLDACDEASREREQSVRRLQQVVAAVEPSRSGRSAGVWQFTPPQVVSHVGGRPSSPRLALLLAVSTLCGVGVSWVGRPLYTGSLIQRVEEVQETLDIPVVGELTLDERPAPRSNQASRKRWVRGLVLGCETMLAAHVFAFLFVALLGSPVVTEFARDPLTAVGGVLDRLWQQMR